MSYSTISILAAIILLIVSRDVLWSRRSMRPRRTLAAYRTFLFGTLAFYASDIAWGVLDERHLMAPIFIDTSIYFLAMASTVVFWTRYAVAYLAKKGSLFASVLHHAGSIFLACEAAAVAVNFVHPILFWYDAANAYREGPARDATLALQIALFLLTALYAFASALRTGGAMWRRHMTIGLFSIVMASLIGVQFFNPLIPFYAMGLMVGGCLLHSFVDEDEKDEYRRKLEKALDRLQKGIERERLQKEELKESREALKDALSAAEQASRAKTAFLSSMSHEIRTPMNAIIGLNSIALNDASASPRMRDYLEKTGASARHLLDIINDVLDMSRIESGRMAVRSEEFRLAGMLEQVSAIATGQCREKGLAYECRIGEQAGGHYVGDAMKLKQVLINILGNAVKFTPKGGRVSLLVEAGPRRGGKAMLKFAVSDTGIGMSPEFLPRLFEAFSQEDSSATSRYGSTGLGMPIAKSLVEMMDGSIDVASEKGRGTTFTVTVTLDESSRRDAPAEDGAMDLHGRRVLAIDDDPIALEHARLVLGQLGAACEPAESGEEGVDKVRLRHLRGEDYSLVLIDWKMAGMDGVEATRRIRAAAGEDTPIVILTSFNWEDVADEARAAGVDGFLSKPLLAGMALDEFRAAVRRRKAAPAAGSAGLKGRRVLLAEDVAVNAEIVAMMLSMQEAETEVAANGRIAVDMFSRSEPGWYDAILMDMRMPEMDGLQASRAIRALDRPDARTVPIIALTANAFDEDVRRSLQAGLDAHLSKPVEPRLLFETLQSLIKRR